MAVMSGTLCPAYGRDYKSKAEAVEAWNAGNDFQLNSYNGSGLVSRREAEASGATSFQIRWKKLEMVAVIKYSKGTWK